MVISNLIKEITSIGKARTLILIDGRGGSGKSTLAKLLCKRLENCLPVNLDEYTLDSTDLFDPKNIKLGFDLDFKNTEYNQSYITSMIQKSSHKYFLLEGCFSFKNINKIKADFKIWVEVEKQLAEKRLNDRESSDPGRKNISYEIITKATEMWQKSEDEYIQDFNPIELADFIYEN